MAGALLILAIVSLGSTAGFGVWAALEYQGANINRQTVVIGIAIAAAVIPYIFMRSFEALAARLPKR